MCVSKYGGWVSRAACSTSATVCPLREIPQRHPGGWQQVTRPSSRAAIASAGRTHSCSVISPPSTVTAARAGAAATKNQVRKRFGLSGGGHHRE